MKTRRVIVLLYLAPLLFSCTPKKAEIPMLEAPAEPVLAVLEQRGRLFTGLKALGSVEIVKHGRKRAFDSVGIAVDGQRRFRLEAYSPLGQSLAAIVWNGSDVMLRLPEQDTVVRHGSDALSQLLGEGVEPSEFCAVLAGGIPAAAFVDPALLRCAGSGECVLELRGRDLLRKVGIVHPPSGHRGGTPMVRSYELIRAGSQVFLAQFDDWAEIAQYVLPLRITLDNRQMKTLITVRYTDADVNIPVSSDIFSLPNEAARPKE